MLTMAHQRRRPAISEISRAVSILFGVKATRTAQLETIDSSRP